MPDYASRKPKQQEERPQITGWRCRACGTAYPGNTNGWDKIIDHEAEEHTRKERDLIRVMGPIAIVELPKNHRYVPNTRFEDRHLYFRHLMEAASDDV